MLLGNPDVFAIESQITTAYAKPGLRALGYFVIYVNGKRYGCVLLKRPCSHVRSMQ